MSECKRFRKCEDNSSDDFLHLHFWFVTLPRRSSGATSERITREKAQTHWITIMITYLHQYIVLI